MSPVNTLGMRVPGRVRLSGGVALAGGGGPTTGGVAGRKLKHNPSFVSSAKLRAWFNPAGIIGVGGGDLLGWNDASNFGYNPTPVATPRPTVLNNALNGYPVAVAASGANQNPLSYQVSGGPTIKLANGSQFTLFCVVMWTSLGGGAGVNPCMGFGDTLNNGVRIELLTSTGHFQVTYANVAAMPANEIPALNVWHYVVLTCNSGTTNAWLDGVKLTGFGASQPSSSGGIGFRIVGGIATIAGDFFVGQLAEAAFYDGVIDGNDRQINLERYARLTYALP